MNTKVLGSKGEFFAKEFLKKKGYKILEINFTNNIGEIDIIAKHKETIVFVEAKARSTFKFGLPSEAVSFSKQNKIRTVALAYLKSTKNLESSVRFDVIEICGEQIRHIENAF